jgi:hypothetical protein
MNTLISKKAVSTIVMIILILCSMVFGALVSYLWVMASYYNMPDNTAFLVVKDPVFLANNVTYFNMTILNPSNSVSDANITAIYLHVNGTTDVYNITATEPSLPFFIKRGTEQLFKCEQNWSNFTGQTVTIEPVPVDASTKNYSYTTPEVTTPKLELNLTPDFNISQTVKYFSLTIENSAESAINLTISEVSIFENIINTDPALPYVLPLNRVQTFRCEKNWEALSGINVTINVKTEEGYETDYTTNETVPGAFLYMSEAKFDYTDTSYFNLTIISLEDSTASATLNQINLTIGSETPITLNTTYPTNINVVPFPIPKNQSQVFKCLWDWSAHRKEVITVDAFTEQGLTLPSLTAITPLSTVWNITDVNFDLDYTEYFLVNVTNMPCSLNEINVTTILIDENVTTMNPPFAILTSGAQETFNCTFDWKTLRGQNVTITVVTQNGSDMSTIVTLPSVKLKLLDDNLVFDLLHSIEINITIPYVNVTISNSINSLQNVTITDITIDTENATYSINNTLVYPKVIPNGYVLTIGENLTFIYFWNWTLYLIQTIKITVYTAEGFQISRTYTVAAPSP